MVIYSCLYEYQQHKDNMNTTYPSSLTDSQWNTILVILKDKRKRKHSLRDIFDAIFYLLKTGCQWRMLPHNFPSWQLVYYYFKMEPLKRFIRVCISIPASLPEEMFVQAWD